MEAGAAAGAGTPPVAVDPLIQAAADELKTLGGCCKDSDNVLERINSMHESLSRQGGSAPRMLRACPCTREPYNTIFDRTTAHKFPRAASRIWWPHPLPRVPSNGKNLRLAWHISVEPVHAGRRVLTYMLGDAVLHVD